MICATRTLVAPDSRQIELRAQAAVYPTIQDLIVDWQQGSEFAAEKIYEGFVEHVRQVVRFHLNRRFQIRCDEEDAVQIVFMEVFRQLRDGCFLFESSEAFQRWIRTVARNRTIKLVKHQMAERRAVSRENHAADSETFHSMIDATQGSDRKGALHVALCDLRDRLAGLDEELQKIVRMLEQNYSQEEIANRLECTTRTIRRRIKQIREFLSAA